MTTPNPSINPYKTTNAAGLFSISESGLVQGVAHPDPATRYALAQGPLATTESLPMWGGVGIFENVPVAGEGSNGGNVGRASVLTSLTGFSVFDQAFNGISSPESPVPLYGGGNTVNFYRLGSGARIALQIDPALVSLDGGLITQQVSWDFVSQRIVQYEPAYAANTITGAVWASTAGGRVTFTVSSDPTSYATAGATIDVSGVVNTGGASTSAFNGAWTVVSSTSTTIVVAAPAAASIGTYASGGSVAGGGGALPVKILKVLPSGCKTVSYDPLTNFATWNGNGACALALI